LLFANITWQLPNFNPNQNHSFDIKYNQDSDFHKLKMNLPEIFIFQPSGTFSGGGGGKNPVVRTLGFPMYFRSFHALSSPENGGSSTLSFRP